MLLILHDKQLIAILVKFFSNPFHTIFNESKSFENAKHNLISFRNIGIKSKEKFESSPGAGIIYASQYLRNDHFHKMSIRVFNNNFNAR